MSSSITSTWISFSIIACKQSKWIFVTSHSLNKTAYKTIFLYKIIFLETQLMEGNVNGGSPSDSPQQLVSCAHYMILFQVAVLNARG